MSSYVNSLIHHINDFWIAFQQGKVLALGNWNYALLYLFSIIQGPTVKLLGGAASAKHLLNLYLVFGVTSSATLTLDLFWYTLGGSGKVQHFLESRSQKKKNAILAAQNAMRKNGTKLIVIGKFATGLGIPIHVAAGISKLKWQRWLPATILGEYLFTAVLVLTGYMMAGTLSNASSMIRTVGTAITVTIVAITWLIMQSIVRKMLAEKTLPVNPHNHSSNEEKN
ncbi:MAG TPA: hypothetical protein VJ965_08385 [Anaerolineales bacterium]|nr:hypothetical protein [Anaerolineales bacterium]